MADDAPPAVETLPDEADPDAKIGFRCEACGRLLRAPASRAGAESACPTCGEPVTVPTDGGLLGSFAAGRPGERRKCPVCGARAQPGDTACRACGEFLDEPDEGLGGLEEGATEVTLTGVWAAAWADWQRHLGILLGAVAVAGAISVGVYMTTYVASMVALFGVFAGAGLGGPGGGGPPDALVIGAIVFFYALQFVVPVIPPLYFSLGLSRLHLAAVRDVPEFGELFRSAGFGRMLLCGGILYVFTAVLTTVPFVGVMFGLEAAGGMGGGGEGVMLALLAGMALSMAAGAGLFAVFWPVPFLIVDRPGLGHVRPLWHAALVPGSGRWGGHLAVGLTAYGVLALGYFFCGVGLIFTGPLAGLLMAHAYDRHTRAAGLYDDGTAGADDPFDDAPRGLPPERDAAPDGTGALDAPPASPG